MGVCRGGTPRGGLGATIGPKGNGFLRLGQANPRTPSLTVWQGSGTEGMNIGIHFALEAQAQRIASHPALHGVGLKMFAGTLTGGLQSA